MKNYFDLTNSEVKEIKEKIEKRVLQFWQTPFTYYINNCVSTSWCPKWLWSAISDLVYWHENQSKHRLDLDIIWYLLNESFYSDKYDEEEKTHKKIVDDIVKYISYEKLKEQTKKWLYSRYLDL